MEYMESKMQGYYESGSALLDELERLKSDRDSILAELQKANGIIIDLQRNPPKLTEEFIAEIKAEAVESAIKYCNLYLAFPVTKGDVAEEVLAISEIKMYAAKVRQGGEK